MLILFVFFALPLSTILLAIVLQKILKCPILVAITFFAIYLIIAFLVFSSNLAIAIIATIIYSVLAYITAVLVKVFHSLRERFFNNSNHRFRCRDNNDDENCCCNDDNDNNNLLRISRSCQNGESNDLLTINSNCNCGTSNSDNSCCCNDNQNRISVRANVVPCNNNNGRTGCIRGCYRRF